MLEGLYLHAGWGHAWGPLLGLALIGVSASAVDAKRKTKLADVSWHGCTEKVCTYALTALTFALLALAVFLPLRTSAPLHKAGVALMVVSGLLVAESFRRFLAITPGTAIRTGPFRWSRNPIYTFSETFLLGMAMSTGSWLFFGLLAAYAVFEHQLILSEERHCLEIFKDYREYMEKTPRYLPIPW